MPLVYDELRKLAAKKLAQEKPGQTLQATALVHEAYVRLVDVDKARTGRVEATSLPPPPRRCGGSSSNGTRKKRAKRGGMPPRRSRPLESPWTPGRRSAALDEALTRLAVQDPIGPEVVKLRFFAGLTLREAAVASGYRSAPRSVMVISPAPGFMPAASGRRPDAE